MQFKKAEAFAAELLSKNLPSTLYYHDVNHTLDVLEAAIRIAATENISKHELTLLKTAAMFHDSGFIHVYADHEEDGCLIAREKLPEFNYKKEEIDIICGMIMATKVPQRPHTLLEKIICDADLDYLGRDDFKAIGAKLYKEWRVRDFIQNEKEWNDMQIRFLQAHHYWTSYSIQKREPQKQKQLKRLIDSMSKFNL